MAAAAGGMDAGVAQECVATIRALCADMVEGAKSGHPGAPIGLAPVAHVLWGSSSAGLRHAPRAPRWPGRDRFVLSNGHGCTLQYALLHLSGYAAWPEAELRRFRQLGATTPGHPENHIVRGGVEVTTGPLGQGVANGVGLAIAEAHLAARFAKPGYEALFGNRTIVMCGDGCLQEGVSAEAISLAGHLGLGRLVLIYDDNEITIDGDTSLSFSEDVPARFAACGWHTLTVKNGDSDLGEIEAALEAAAKVTDKPTLISVKTTIGFGSTKEGTQKVHGAPLGAEDLAQLKEKFGMDPAKSFVIPDAVRAVYAAQAAEGEKAAADWAALFAKYKEAFPAEGAELERRLLGGEAPTAEGDAVEKAPLSGVLPESWRDALPAALKPEDAAKATRQHGGAVLNGLAKSLPELVGGSADLNPSCLTYLEGSADFLPKSPEGRNIRFGVREHAMGAICNGMAAYGGLRPFCSTFLNFIQYALPAVRLSAISEFPVLYVMTHDSIGLGEDGPTHQPINALMLCRTMPNCTLLRPADGNEVAGAYASAMANSTGPTVVCLTRQGVPNLEGSSADKVAQGAYVLRAGSDADKPKLILVGTGSETSLCVEAAKILEAEGVAVRVVSMPSWELFAKQDLDYRRSVFPAGAAVLAVEAASTVGWREHAHAVVGMETFGASAPIKDLLAKFGFTPDAVAQKGRDLITFFGDAPAPSVVDRPF